MTDTNNTTNQQEEFSFIEWLKLLLGLNTENDKEKVYDKAAECYNKYVAGDGKENQITGEKLKKNDGNIQDTVKKNFEKKLEDKRVKNSLLFEKAINLMRTAGGQEATPKEIKQVEQVRENLKKEQEELKKYENELATLCGSVDENKVNDKIKDNESRIQAYEDSNNNIIAPKIKKFNQDNDDLSNSIAFLKSENNHLDGQIKDFSEEIKRNKSEYEKFENQLLNAGISKDAIQFCMDNDIENIKKALNGTDSIDGDMTYHYGELASIKGGDLLLIKNPNNLDQIEQMKIHKNAIDAWEPHINDLKEKKQTNETTIEQHQNVITYNKKQLDTLEVRRSKNEQEIKKLTDENTKISDIKKNKKTTEQRIADLEKILIPELCNKVDYSKALNEFKQSVGAKEYSTYMKAMETAYSLGIDPKKALKTVENYKPIPLSREWFRERKEKKKLDRLTERESKSCCGDPDSVFKKLQEKCDKETPFRIFGRKEEKKAINNMCLAVASGYEKWLEGEGKGSNSVEQNKKIIDLFHEYIENPANEKFKVGSIGRKFIKNLETRLNKDQKKLEMADKSYRKRCDKNAKLNKTSIAKKYGKNYYKEAKEELKNEKEKEARESKKNIKQTKQEIKNLKKDIERLEKFKGNLGVAQQKAQELVSKKAELKLKKAELNGLKKQHNDNLQEFGRTSEELKNNRKKFKESVKETRKTLKKNEELNKSSNIYKSFKKDKGAKENIKTEASDYSKDVQNKRNSNTKSTKSTLESLNIIKPTNKNVNTSTVNSSSIPTSKSKATEMVKNAPTSIV